MNIQNRLKQMENQVLKVEPGFCDCPETQKTFYLDRTSDSTDKTIPPDFCETCGKAVNKIIVELVDE